VVPAPSALLLAAWWGCVVVVGLPVSVLSLLAGAAVVGFSGSVAPAAASLAAVAQVAAALPVGAPVVVGDAPGVDQRARQLVPRARVFFASTYGSGRGSFAARSIACVQACAPAGVWCSFPARPAPAGLRPSSSAAACFSGLGSGTYASLAFALGSGLGAVVFLPAGVVSPGWGLSPAGGGWFVALLPARQLSLF